MGEAVESLVELLGNKKEDEDEGKDEGEEGREEESAAMAVPAVVNIPLPPSLASLSPGKDGEGGRERGREGGSCRMDVTRLESLEGEEEDVEDEEEGGHVQKVQCVLPSSLPPSLPPSLPSSL